MLNLTPTELFFVYETLTNTVAVGSEQQENKQFVLAKVRQELLDRLISFKAESNKVLYDVWMNQEEQRLKDLSKKNNDLKMTAPAAEEISSSKLTKKKYTAKTNTKKKTR